MAWSPAGQTAVIFKGEGWSVAGPEVAMPDPEPGWSNVPQASAGADSSSVTVGDLLAKLVATANGSTLTVASALVHFIATQSSSAADAGAVKAMLVATSTSTGDGSARGSFTAVAPGESVSIDAAAILVHLVAAETSLSEDLAALTAHLAGSEAAIESGAALGVFSTMAPELTAFTTPGSFFVYNIPPWTRYLDFVAIGGGASGRTGNGATNSAGKGGKRGETNTATVGYNPAVHSSSMSVAVGAGGAQAANTDAAASNPGGLSRVAFSALPGAELVAQGGASERSDASQDGESSPGGTYQGISYPAGVGGTGNGGAGQVPGGAGAGGNGGFFGTRTRGGAGATGRVLIRAYQ